MTGPEFFAMARRTFLFDGVMAVRKREEDQAQQPTSRPVPQQAAQSAAQREQAQVVDLATFRAMHPGVVELASDKQD